jgi:hypothetical protein
MEKTAMKVMTAIRGSPKSAQNHTTKKAGEYNDNDIGLAEIAIA